MQFVERQVIKPNHRFYPEADRQFFQSKNHNCDNYIYRQNFFPRQPINALTVDRPRSKSIGDKALPALVTQNTLRLLQKAWISYHNVTGYGAGDRQTKFPAAPKIPYYKKSRKTRYRCRHVVVFNCQTVRGKTFAKGYAPLHETNIFMYSKVT